MNIIQSLGPVQIVDSFVLGVLKKGHGHGEGRLYIGPQSNNKFLDSFFDNFNPKNVYSLSHREINRYFEINESLFSNPIDKFNNPKQLASHFETQSKYFISNPNGHLILSFMDATGAKDKTRRYVRYLKGDLASEKAWQTFRQLFIPNRATLTFHKTDKRHFFEITVNTSESTIEKINELETKDEFKRIESSSKITTKKRYALVSSRYGQGDFRDDVLRFWGKCAISGMVNPALIQACHIKDWSKATDAERLDQENGIMLTHTLHRAFDEGLICFNLKGELEVSPFISKHDAKILGVTHGQKIFKSLTKKQKEFLSWKLDRFRAL
jgi:hypothetical protein